jgi:hypothetical protein
MTLTAEVKLCSDCQTNSYELAAVLLATKSNMRKHTEHAVAICHNPSIHNFKGDRKKP